MKTVTINQFNGGLAEDVREQKTNTFSTCKGFDSLSYDHRLIPFGETEAEALASGDITDKRFSDIIRSAGNLLAIGRNSSGSPTAFDLFSKASDTDIASTWSSFTSLAGAGGYRNNSLVEYKSKFYVLDTSFGVRRYDGSWSTIGALDITSYWDSILVPKPIIHPMDDILYLAAGQYLAKINNTTYSDITSVVIPTTQYISSLADYDAYLAIATVPIIEGGKSRVYLWNRDTSLSTFTSNIDFGEGSLMILENIGGTLIGVSISDANYTSSASYTVSKNKKLIIRALSGNQSVKLKEYLVDSTFSLKNIKCTVGNKLYFGGDNSDSLFVIEKQPDGKIIVSKDRFIANGTTVTTLRGFTVIGDYLFAMYDTEGGSGYCYRTKVTSSYTNTSTYETLINPSMEINDRTKKKKLKAVSIAKSSSTGQLVLKYSVDGSSYTTIGTLSSGGSIVLKGTNESNGKPFVEGYEFQFKVESTSGAEFTELKYAYEVIPELI